MRSFIVLMCLACSLLFGENIKVAAAANITYAIEEIKDAFIKQNPDINVFIALGSSGKLSTQIRNGADFDLFLSANMGFVENLQKDGFSANIPKIYAKGKLAFFSVRGFDIKKGLKILKDKNIKTICIANPKTAPYGTASVEAFKNDKIYDGIKDKLIQSNSISETLAQTLKACDVGFVAASAMYSKKMSQYKNDFVLVNTKLYKPINQGIIILKRAQNSSDAKKFYDFILSEQAKKIFTKYGYDI